MEPVMKPYCYRDHMVSTTPRHNREQQLPSPGKEFSPRTEETDAPGTAEHHYVTAEASSWRDTAGGDGWMGASSLWRGSVALRGKCGPLARCLRLTPLSTPHLDLLYL
jgi:hypothetical protein